MTRKVFVLGAGFTKAFFGHAPLLLDNYDIASLRRSIAGLYHAERVLDLEVKRDIDGRIDIERLMTRLENGMPYDKGRKADQELGILRTKVYELFTQTIEKAKSGPNSWSELVRFANHCAWNCVDIITFNHDDIFDEALAQPIQTPPNESRQDIRRWTPDSGYGFPCECLGDRQPLPTPARINPPSGMLLLKLHGSMNWRVRLGARQPFELKSIVHLENWRGELLTIEGKEEYHLEPLPFIVPPVLTKGDLVEQPILRLVWGRAYQTLSLAEEVFFIGYSFPPTDVASIHLFSEAVGYPKVRVSVINWATDPEKEDETIRAYSRVFPEIPRSQFRFDGALKWSKEFWDGSSNTRPQS